MTECEIMKTVNIKGMEVPEERVVLALQFIDDLEKQGYQTDFIQTSNLKGVESNV